MSVQKLGAKSPFSVGLGHGRPLLDGGWRSGAPGSWSCAPWSCVPWSRFPQSCVPGHMSCFQSGLHLKYCRTFWNISFCVPFAAMSLPVPGSWPGWTGRTPLHIVLHVLRVLVKATLPPGCLHSIFLPRLYQPSQSIPSSAFWGLVSLFHVLLQFCCP